MVSHGIPHPPDDWAWSHIVLGCSFGKSKNTDSVSGRGCECCWVDVNLPLLPVPLGVELDVQRWICLVPSQFTQTRGGCGLEGMVRNYSFYL